MTHWNTSYIPEIETNKLQNKFVGCTAENAYLMVTRIPWSMFLLHKSSVGQIILDLLLIPKFHCRVHKSCHWILPWTRCASTIHVTILSAGWDKEVCTVIRYGPGIESRWGARFSASVQGLNSHLYNVHRISLPEVKRLGSGVDDPPPSSAEVEERAQVYLYSPFRPSCPVLGWTLHFMLYVDSF